MEDDFMKLIQWINGEPFAVGLHRKKFLVGGFENLADVEREALMYERDWHDKYGLKGDQYIMNFQKGGLVSLPAAQKINNYFNKLKNGR